jgi:membrane protein
MTIVSLIHNIKTFLKKIKNDYVSAFSAQAAFFIIISFFPFIMFLLTLIQYLPITQSSLLEIGTSIVPQALKSYVVSLIQEIYSNASGTIISITVISALWSASRGFLAITKGLNSVYDINETRNFIKLRITSTLYTLVFAFMLIATLGFLVFGNRLFIWIENKFPLLSEFALVIISVRTIVGLLLIFLFFIILYLFIPNRKSNFLSELPGAIITSVGWISFSYLYSFYIDNVFNSSNNMYGSLTAVVLLMLWLYACMYLMFIGAEVNVFLQTRLKREKGRL